MKLYEKKKPKAKTKEQQPASKERNIKFIVNNNNNKTAVGVRKMYK